MEEVMFLRSELCDCIGLIHSDLVKVEDAMGKLQVVPLLPKLQVGSFEHMGVCSSFEQELSVVVDDEAIPEIMSKADVEDFVDKALEDSCVRGWRSLHFWLLLPSFQALPIVVALYVGCLLV
jgi:hypothetical protein